MERALDSQTPRRTAGSKGQKGGASGAATSERSFGILSEEEKATMRSLPVVTVGQWQEYVEDSDVGTGSELQPRADLHASRSLMALPSQRRLNEAKAKERRARRASQKGPMPSAARGGKKLKLGTVVREAKSGGMFGGGGKEAYSKLAEKIMQDEEVADAKKSQVNVPSQVEKKITGKAPKRRVTNTGALGLGAALKSLGAKRNVMQKDTDAWAEDDVSLNSDEEEEEQEERKAVTFGKVVSNG